jgi:DNA-binding response OmpR family regulator
MKTRVLIVDDDASVRQSLRKVLTVAGYEVTTAADGQEAVAQFVPGQIDLVILDLNLPLCSGWDVFERLTTQHPTTPLIIVTGLPNQYPTAMAAGVGALMEKPIDAPELLRTMDELLAEPPEARLRRMCGYQQDTRYVRPPNAGAAGRLCPAPVRFAKVSPATRGARAGRLGLRSHQS